MYFDIEIIRELRKKDFDPAPRVGSFIIKFYPKKKLSKNQELLREIFKRKDKKLRNALMEALIHISKQDSTREMTKKQAKEKIEEWKIPDSILCKKVTIMSLEDFLQTKGKIKL